MASCPPQISAWESSDNLAKTINTTIVAIREGNKNSIEVLRRIKASLDKQPVEINHDILLSLGFIELFNRPGRYAYKGVTGRLMANGAFHLHGFSPLIEKLTDLKYVLMLVDYNHPSPIYPYSYHVN